MIEYIKGEITDLTPTYAVLENNGIGYLLNISLNCYTFLQGQSNCRLYVHEAIREDAHILYGFADLRERELFLLLITVSGVGAGTARMILSSFRPAELEQIIATGNDSQLKAVKGIGGKTAQRIIVDLKDKINAVGDSLLIQATPSSEHFDEAFAALVTLGFPKQAAQKVLKKLYGENPDLAVDVAIKLALKML